jgi:hypothetical protein
MDQPISLNGKKMRVVSTAKAGVVNFDTLFTFKQKGLVVSAHYSGGKVRMGYLVGVILTDALRFQYAQLDTEGQLDGGYSTCEIKRTPDGRIRLLEHFQWESREGSGTNIFEEVTTSQ